MLTHPCWRQGHDTVTVIATIDLIVGNPPIHAFLHGIRALTGVAAASVELGAFAKITGLLTGRKPAKHLRNLRDTRKVFVSRAHARRAAPVPQ